MANSNGNKTKNWLYRLRHLKIRRRSTDNSNNADFAAVVYRRSLSSCDTDTTNYARAHSNFRKSLRKMHTRVKNAFKYKHPNSRHTIHSSAPSSSSHSRVTLNSSSTHRENIYTLEPVKKIPVEPTIEEEIFDIPSRLRGINDLPPDDLVSANSAEGIVIPPRNITRRTFPQLSEIQNGRIPKNEVVSLLNFYWYWGPISRMQAEERLHGFPDGAFLIRDSSSERYIFTMSFRSVGRTLHTRIEQSKSGYSLFDQGGYHSIEELVKDALSKSKNGVYCYTKSRDEINPNYPVRLTLPISRYDKVPSLKYLSRFVIRQCININEIEKLPLPLSLISYLQEDGPYF